MSHGSIFFPTSCHEQSKISIVKVRETQYDNPKIPHNFFVKKKIKRECIAVGVCCNSIMFTSYFDVVKPGFLFPNLKRIDAETALTVTRVSKHKKFQDTGHIFDSHFL